MLKMGFEMCMKRRKAGDRREETAVDFSVLPSCFCHNFLILSCSNVCWLLGSHAKVRRDLARSQFFGSLLPHILCEVPLLSIGGTHTHIHINKNVERMRGSKISEHKRLCAVCMYAHVCLCVSLYDTDQYIYIYIY